MNHALYYPPADRSIQWAYSKYPGDLMNTNTVVWHTTETVGWPSYSTGYYPTFTYNHAATKRWRQHLPINRSARALENDPGGVETNTVNCAQVEIVGTCDPAWFKAHGGLFVPKMPADMVEDLAAFCHFMLTEWGVKLLAAPKWPAYPTSYANGGGQRFTATQWRDFYGHCGHEHVPENAHGDPGNMPMGLILSRAAVLGQPTPAPSPSPTPPPPVPTDVDQARYEALLDNHKQTQALVKALTQQVVALTDALSQPPTAS